MAIIEILTMSIGLIESAVELVPKIKAALASSELMPDMRKQLEERIRAAQEKLAEWK
jgi:hypothetical protein